MVHIVDEDVVMIVGQDRTCANGDYWKTNTQATGRINHRRYFWRQIRIKLYSPAKRAMMAFISGAVADNFSKENLFGPKTKPKYPLQSCGRIDCEAISSRSVITWVANISGSSNISRSREKASCVFISVEAYLIIISIEVVQVKLRLRREFCDMTNFGFIRRTNKFICDLRVSKYT